jgi:hypothetical protein
MTTRFGLNENQLLIRQDPSDNKSRIGGDVQDFKSPIPRFWTYVRGIKMA